MGLARVPGMRITMSSSAAAAASASSRRTGASCAKRSRSRWHAGQGARPGVEVAAHAGLWRLRLGQRDRRHREHLQQLVSRILRLVLLAPDLVEAILAGRTDQPLMLETLRAAPTRLDATARSHSRTVRSPRTRSLGECRSQSRLHNRSVIASCMTLAGAIEKRLESEIARVPEIWGTCAIARRT